MDPSKKIGKMFNRLTGDFLTLVDKSIGHLQPTRGSKEQIELEKTSRRCYPKKWGTLGQPEAYAFYNQDELNRQLRQSAPAQGVQEAAAPPFAYSGHGDSYFVSPNMWDALVANCRCGRWREGTHLLKCVQRQQCSGEGAGDDDTCTNNNNDDNKGRRLPETSSALIGWRDGGRTRYGQWEQSTRYVSPVLTMPGPRITAIPYNAIIIG